MHSIVGIIKENNHAAASGEVSSALAETSDLIKCQMIASSATSKNMTHMSYPTQVYIMPNCPYLLV